MSEDFDLGQEIAFHMAQKTFNLQYKTWDKGTHEWFSVGVSFPQDFCQRLEKLSFPDWYVACFMSECTDSSIWGAYGNHHKAVCLKFKAEGIPDSRKLTLSTPSLGTDGVLWTPSSFEFKKVSYDADFVQVDFFRSIGMRSVIQLNRDWYVDELGSKSSCADFIHKDVDGWRESYWRNYLDGVTVKLGDWKRENEYRLVQYSTIMDLGDLELRKLRYDFNSLEGVIFGINTSLEHKVEIVRKVRGICAKYERKEFSFYQARYDSSARKIRVDKIDIPF
ncbi:hypothetical protein D9M69_449080 [compost metagenome]